MEQYIDKDALVVEIENRIKETEFIQPKFDQFWVGQISAFKGILKILDTLEVKDPYEQMIQYSSIKDGIEAYAKTYSFNIESLLFNQLTKEQQALWRKEIEQACISGGDECYLLAKDIRYKENTEVKKMDLEKDVRQILSLYHEGLKHYEDIIKKEREENGGSDLAIKIMDGVVDARELSVQYVLDKLKAQKGEEV